MRARKEERNIKNDIKEIYREYQKYGVRRVSKEIRCYYEDNRYNEDTLLFRINKLQNYNTISNILFGFPITAILGFLFGILIEKLTEVKTYSYFIAVVIIYLIVGVLFILGLYIFLRINTTIKNGRDNYIDKEEIEIIISIIEGSSKRKYRRYRRT